MRQQSTTGLKLSMVRNVAGSRIPALHETVLRSIAPEIRRILVVDDDAAFARDGSALDAWARSLNRSRRTVRRSSRAAGEAESSSHRPVVERRHTRPRLANALKQRDPSQLVALWSSGLDVTGMKYLIKYQFIG